VTFGVDFDPDCDCDPDPDADPDSWWIYGLFSKEKTWRF